MFVKWEGKRQHTSETWKRLTNRHIHLFIDLYCKPCTTIWISLLSVSKRRFSLFRMYFSFVCLFVCTCVRVSYQKCYSIWALYRSNYINFDFSSFLFVTKVKKAQNTITTNCIRLVIWLWLLQIKSLFKITSFWDNNCNLIYIYIQRRIIEKCPFVDNLQLHE